MLELLLGIVAVGLVIGAIILYSSLSWGLVVLKFWAWFILPVVPLLPTITYTEAVGLALFITLFRNHGSSGIKKEYKDESEAMTTVLLAPWMVLLCGWVVKVFVL